MEGTISQEWSWCPGPGLVPERWLFIKKNNLGTEKIAKKEEKDVSVTQA